MKRYNPSIIEAKWQKAWQAAQTYRAEDFSTKPKYYLLTEFPYPSGSGMHIGHMREYTYGDILSRFKRANGYNVLYPMGFDSFGLPTENYAIKNHISPVKATEDNIASFKIQLERMGFSFDWQRQINTSDPAYYKWTQWLFLEFFKAGLAYQKEIDVNWCPFCKTGLANEEVVNSRHERCDTLVEKKTLKQWVLRITAYADRLIDGLTEVDYTPRIAEQQINWIGRSVGVEIDFKIQGSSEVLTVFTTRPDTLFGASFLVIAPEHPLLQQLTPASHRASVDSYLAEVQHKTELDRLSQKKAKTGVFSGAYAINPINNQAIPIWTADYVLASYGSGAIMAVPAHDSRDFEFAQANKLAILPVIKPKNRQHDFKLSAYVGSGLVFNSSKDYDGLTNQEVASKITDQLIKQAVGRKVTNYKLRDWIFSRQHYWGEPIPIIHCQDHGPVAVPKADLPVVLPVVDSYLPTDDGQSPLSKIADWLNVPCPICGKPAKREADTMPNWAGSSWYYLRYLDPNNDQEFVNRQILDYWQNVDLYIGGMEHVTLHLLYSRFWHQFLYDQGLVPTKEPYERRRGQGIILASDHTKMSKSKGNTIDPLEIIDSGYGADALRLAVIFLSPYDYTTSWSPETLAGCYRYLSRVWSLYVDYSPHKSQENPQLDAIVNNLVAAITDNLNNLNFNVAVASLMEALNKLYKIKASDNFSASNWQTVLEKYCITLSVFCPHIAEELWVMLGHQDLVVEQAWPDYQEMIQEDLINLPVQFNGKLRGQLQVKSGLSEAEVIKLVQADAGLAKYFKDESPKKIIYLMNKIINFVV